MVGIEKFHGVAYAFWSHGVTDDPSQTAIKSSGWKTLLARGPQHFVLLRGPRQTSKCVFRGCLCIRVSYAHISPRDKGSASHASGSRFCGMRNTSEN